MSTADRFLLEQWIRRRDAGAFKALSIKYVGLVYGTCLRVLRNPADAEDVTQECFVALAAITSGPQGSMGAWLHAIATRKALNHRRSDLRRRAREERYARDKPVITEIQWDDVSRFVDEAIESLPNNLRDTIVSHFMDDLSVTEIAKLDGVTHSAISQRLQKGVFLIREHLRRRGVVVTASVLATMFAEHAFAAPVTATALPQTLGKIALSVSSVAAPHVTTSASPGMKGAAAVFLAAIVLVGAWNFVTHSQSQPVRAVSFDEIQPPVTEAVERVESFVAATPAPIAESHNIEIATEPPEPEIIPVAVEVAQPSASPIENWRDVVKAYRDHQDRIRSITVEYEDRMKGNYFHPDYSERPGYREANQWGTLSTDGDRCYLEQNRWGDWFGGEIMPEDRADFHACAWNGSDFFEYHGGGGSDYGIPGSLQFWMDAKNTRIGNTAFDNGRVYNLFNRYPGAPMLGYPVPIGRKIEEFLYTTHNVALRLEMEPINDTDCYVVDAETDFGTFAVWFDPTHDYNIAKFTMIKRPGHLVEDFMLTEGMSHDYEYQIDQFEKVDGLWVPKASTFRQCVVALGGDGFDYTSQHKRTSISLNGYANYDGTYALRADDIPNGSHWMNTENPMDQTRYVWYDGKVVPKTERNSYRPTPAQERARGLVAGAVGAGSTRSQ